MVPTLYFVTTNSGKVASAQRSLGSIANVVQLSLQIPEEQDTVAEIARFKAETAYDSLHAPVLCDDSGFVIPSMNGYPGVRVGRELRTHGVEYFTALAQAGHERAYFTMTLAYMDEGLTAPKLFTSNVHGKLVPEMRGDLNKPFVKSELAGCFIVDGHSKTIAEMSNEEYATHLATDRWNDFIAFYKERI